MVAASREAGTVYPCSRGKYLGYCAERGTFPWLESLSVKLRGRYGPSPLRAGTRWYCAVRGTFPWLEAVL